MTIHQKLIAFALPPLWIPLFFLSAVSSFRADPVLADMSTGEMVLILLVLGLLVGYGAMLAFGLPLHLLLKWRGWQSLAAYATAGFLTGALLRALAIGLIWLDYGLAVNDPGASIVAAELTEKPIILLTAGLAGLLVFSSFRMLIRRRAATT